MLKRTFINWNVDTLKTLYTSFVRPHLEYASAAWSPYCKQDIKILENVQRRATKLVPSIRNLTYEQRLKSLNLTTLENRRIRGDLIQQFKFIKGYNTISWFHPNLNSYSIKIEGPAGNIRGDTTGRSSKLAHLDTIFSTTE